MKHGDRVITPSGKTGTIVKLLGGQLVKIRVACYPYDGRKEPQQVITEVIYHRNDVRTI